MKCKHGRMHRRSNQSPCLFYQNTSSHTLEITQTKFGVSVSVFRWLILVSPISLRQFSLYSYAVRLDDPGIESRSGRDIPNPSRPALRSTRVSYTIDTWYFLGLRLSGCDVDHKSHLTPRLKKVQSYIFIPPLCLRSLFLGEIYF